MKTKEFSGTDKYYLAEDLKEIVNIAMVMEKPLLLMGEAGTGKTNICLQASRECASLDFRVAYIDTEGVSIERLRQICNKSYDYKKILKNILFFNPTSFECQEKMLSDALQIKDLKLIIVDTFNLFYRFIY